MKRILCFALAITFLLCSCGGNPSNSAEDKKSSSETSSAENTEKDQDNSVGIDGTITGECFSISIVDVKWIDALEASLYTVTPEKEGSKLLCLFFSAKNITEDTKNLGMFNAYVNSQATLPTALAGSIDEAMPFVGAVASGMEMKTYVVWELPEDWEEFQLNYFEATGPECKQHFVIYPKDIG